MDNEKLIKSARRLAKTYRITEGKDFRLKDFDPADTLQFKSEDKPRAKKALAAGIRILEEFQEKLYAEDKWAVLLIFQAMDAAGKDGAIKHVMSGVNPQGCQVYSFKVPAGEELDHDYLWRCTKKLPERGRIGIFNRSYYEEVLVVRVHPQFLENQKMPPELITQDIWEKRYRDIRNFEHYLTGNGIVICKFFLHLSRKEQQRRFLERLDNPEKHWKFSSADVRERQSWGKYMKAYEEMIINTATKDAPWYVIPADNKWFTRLVVAAAVIDRMAALDLKFPEVSAGKLKELADAREELLNEK